ncbi:hypothetical protein ILYODFUR_032784 [Ilyodon furcidens]|uniref:Uncharacterized protein n=1 Tax=Ilyodon furcidens TaxID=33524 RepID=A0ABV0U2K2_9TELE
MINFAKTLWGGLVTVVLKTVTGYLHKKVKRNCLIQAYSWKVEWKESVWFIQELWGDSKDAACSWSQTFHGFHSQ